MDAAERRAWLKERQTGLGGTDLAAIAGVGFRSAAEVYAEKVAAEAADERAGDDLLAFGLETEPINARRYERRTGLALAPGWLARSPLHPWAFATLDAAALATADPRPVDFKYAAFPDGEWGPDGSDQVPEGYVVQLTWQALVLQHGGVPATRGDVSLLTGRGEHRIYVIPFDDRLAGLLLALGAEFWARVESRAGVEDWRSPLADEVGSRLAEIRPDTAVELGDDAAYLADCYELHRQQEKSSKGAAEDVRARLQGLLAGAAEGRLPDGRRVRQKVVERKGYTVEPGRYVDFRVAPAPKVRTKKGAPKSE